MIQHWWAELRKVMLVKCRAFINITIRSIFKLCRMPLIRLTGLSNSLKCLSFDFYEEHQMPNWCFTMPLIFSAQLTKAYQTANVLFEVLKAVNLTQSIEVDREVRHCDFLVLSLCLVFFSSLVQRYYDVWYFQILEAQDKVAEKTQLYVHYNILPLDPDSANQAIMRYPEVSLFVVPLWPPLYICNMLSVGNVILTADPSCCSCSSQH